MQKCALTLYLSRLSPNSRRSIHSQFLSIGRILGWPLQEVHERIQNIDYESAIKCRSIMVAQGYSARSVNRSIIALKGLLKVSALLGNIEQFQLLQIQSIPNLRLNEHKGSPLSLEHVNALFAVLDQAKTNLDIRNSAILALFLATGLRRSELVALKLSDYSHFEMTIFVSKGKGNKSRIAYLPSWLSIYLDNWVNVRGNAEGYLFCKLNNAKETRNDDRTDICRNSLPKSLLVNGLKLSSMTSESAQLAPLDGSTAYRVVKKLTAKIGLFDATPHDFRRTFITRLLELNIDLNTVRQMAGHASISTTTLYDKRDRRFMQQAANRLNFTE